MADLLVPMPAVIADVRAETSDTKTFRIENPAGGKPFAHMPGQCAMLSIPGVGEAMFSISSAPTDPFMEISIKSAGTLTGVLHGLAPGSPALIRGPYGTPFPVETDLPGQNLLFVAGGIGIAPLRSVIRYVFANRANYGAVDIVYGARSADDLVFLEEIRTEWAAQPNTRIHLTIDRPQDDWDGHVGFVPAYLPEIGFDNNRTALICGPPIMIKYALAELLSLGFGKTQIYTTLEMRMKCGIGKCGRCNIGPKFICKDGPVFRCDELEELPDEY